MKRRCIFSMGWRNRFLYLYRPALLPYLKSCLKVSLGMAWKSGAAAEIIGLPSYSLGEKLYMSKVQLDTAGLFAWTLTIIMLSFLFEKAVLKLLQLFGEWKPRPVLAHRALRGGAAHMPIRLSHIDFSFGGNQILSDYSVTLDEGGKYLLTAPSGAGKTTLLKIIAGLLNVDSGTVTGVPSCAGMVFQEDRLCEDYDAICNIMLGMDKKSFLCSNNEGDITRVIAREAARILPEDCIYKPVRELSGGMRRRVALLRALLSDTNILLLDEPFSGLDEENRIRCAQYIRERLNKRTLIAATHSREDANLLDGVNIF